MRAGRALRELFVGSVEGAVRRAAVGRRVLGGFLVHDDIKEGGPLGCADDICGIERLIRAIFLVLAGANHVREMARDRNFSAGNTTILLYDFGLPISYAVALFSLGAA